MPELPEVAQTTLSLNREILNKEILDVKIHSGRYSRHGMPEGYNSFIKCLPIKVAAVAFRGKFIYITTQNSQCEWFIWNTLGMSGSWKKNKSKHSHVELIFSEFSIFFTDMRNFGTLKFSNSRLDLEKKISSIGPDHLNFQIPDYIFSERLLLRKKDSLAKALMNQKLIGGIGNYIKAEALYRAKLSPHRIVETLSTEDFSLLNKEIENVIKASFATGGATISTYSGMNEEMGKYVFSFHVYGRKKCIQGFEVRRETTTDGRTTHWVPEIQK